VAHDTPALIDAPPLAVPTTPPAPVDPSAADVRALVEATLREFLASAVNALVALDPALRPLATLGADAVLGGGKRIRPTFAYWGWRGVVGPSAPVGPVVPALAALELLHAFALVHDDVMDRAATRRGHPTAHRVLAALHRDRGLRGDPEHFGQSGAILVGDLCLVWADQLMARARLAGVPGERIRAARDTYDRMRIEAIAGQFLDVLSESAPQWSVDRALRTVRLKTAGYTVVRPLHYGAALAGPTGPPGAAAGVSVRRPYTRYGLAVGEAFQLRDDLLDVYGEPSVTGKPAGADLIAGKATVLLEIARSRASARQAGELERLLRRGPAADVDRIGVLLRATGATRALHRMISTRVADAVAAIDDAPIDGRARHALADLARAVAWRAA
jgi:geranylgeranyl diphosphate synthase type I